MDFGEKIISWYHRHKRELPWRNTRDPYKIWLSEIILQQTRVNQGMSYYQRFTTKFPSLEKLANASEDDILKLWQGLGYYSRARNLHHTAKDVMKRFGGKFPDDYSALTSLKGIGEYTASAILSFAYHQKFAVADGNVFRVLSRYLGIATPINSSVAKKEFTQAALLLMAGHPPQDFNQAIMEFGALQCKPLSPDCAACPLNGSCIAFANKLVQKLPVKLKKTAVRKRYLNYLCIHQGKKILIRKRTGNDIWKNLYDFPVIETGKRVTVKKLLMHESWKKYFSESGFQLMSDSATIKHQLTHQTIYARFLEIRVTSKVYIDGAQLISKNELRKLAVPRLIENYLTRQEKNRLS